MLLIWLLCLKPRWVSQLKMFRLMMTQLSNFLMLCQETMLKESGMMEDEEMMEDEDVEVKVIKVHDGDIHGMMDKVLKGHSY
jgi:hypothetical protein